MASDLRTLWLILVALARFGPGTREGWCGRVGSTTTGKCLLWMLWFMIEFVSAHAMLSILAQRPLILADAAERGAW